MRRICLVLSVASIVLLLGACTEQPLEELPAAFPAEAPVVEPVQPELPAEPVETPPVEEDVTVTYFIGVSPQIDSPVTWDNVLARYDELTTIVYQDVLQTIERNKLIPGYNDTVVDIYKGPNLNPLVYQELEQWIDDSFAFYANTMRIDRQIYLLFPYEDLEWAVDQLSTPQINFPGYEEIIRNANQGPEQGSRQNVAPGNKVGEFVGIWSLPENQTARYTPITDAAGAEKAMFFHEQTHQFQQAQWKRIDLNRPDVGLQSAPCFLHEGMVTPIELILVSNTVEIYRAAIKERILGAYTSDPTTRDELGNFTGYSKFEGVVDLDFAMQYLTNSFEFRCTTKLQYGLSYSYGYLATEGLMAIGGAESPMAVFMLMGEYDFTWDEAFERVYGISWDEALPILAELIVLNANKF